MSNLPESLDEFLSEISASLESSSEEAALRRLNSERILKIISEDIVQDYPDLHIRFLADKRIAGQSGADLLMQIDDYEIRIELVDSPDEKITIEPEQLDYFKKIFIDNPSTEAIVIVWASDELLSLQINLFDIEKLKSNPKLLTKYTSKVEPFSETIKDVLTNFLKIWDTKDISFPKDVTKKLNIQENFTTYLQETLSTELGRRFIKEEKRLAAERISEIKEINFIQDVLEDALKGNKSEVLTKRLVQLPK